MGKHLIEVDSKLWSKVKAIASIKNLKLPEYVVLALKTQVSQDIHLIKEILDDDNET